MATIVNRVNELLYSAAERVTGATVKISPGASSVIVIPKGNNIPVPASVTLTATTTGYSNPQFSWSIRYGTSGSFTSLNPGNTNPVTITTDSAWLTGVAANATIMQIKVDVTEPSQPSIFSFGANASSDTLTIPIIREGNDGASGTSINSLTLTLYKRTTTSTAPTVTTTGTSTYTFNTSLVVGQPTGWTQAVPSNASGGYLWSISVPVASAGNSYAFLNTLWSAPILALQDGTKGINTAVVYAYKRSATAVTDNPGNVTYSFTTNSVSDVSLANLWSKTIPTDSTDPLYVTVATAASTESTASILASQWTTPGIISTNSVSTATVTLYLRNNNSTTAPSVPSTGSCTYTFLTGVLSGTIPSGWSQTVPALSVGNVLWITQATAAGTASTDIIQNTEWSAAKVLSAIGNVRGSLSLYSTDAAYVSTYTYPTFAAGAASYAAKATALIASKAATISAVPTTPLEGDIVTFTNGSNYVYTITYNSSTSAWQAPGTIIDGSLLVTNSITASKINTNGLTIKDSNGTTIFAAGTPLSSSYMDSTFVNSVATAQSTATSAQATATSASNAVADKLSKSSASTLSATISVDAVSGAGFRAGNLTWDAAGARVSGKGVAITPAGIMGHNGTSSTFNISATTGDATFGGVAQSADGKFVIDFKNKTITITV